MDVTELAGCTYYTPSANCTADLSGTTDYYRYGHDDSPACYITNYIITGQSFLAAGLLLGQACGSKRSWCRITYAAGRLCLGLAFLFAGLYHHLLPIGNVETPLDLDANLTVGSGAEEITVNNRCYDEGQLRTGWGLWASQLSINMLGAALQVASYILFFEGGARKSSRVAAIVVCVIGVVLFVLPLTVSNNYLLTGAVITLFPFVAELVCGSVLLCRCCGADYEGKRDQIAAALIILASFVEIVPTVHAQLVVGSACWTHCPEDCPYPASFNNNAVFHVAIIVAYLITDPAMALLLLPTVEGSLKKKSTPRDPSHLVKA